MEHDFTSGSVWKKLLLFAVPIFGANLLQALYGTVDLFVVGLFADASAVFSRVDRKHDDADDHRDHHGTYDGMYRFARTEYR